MRTCSVASCRRVDASDSLEVTSSCVADSSGDAAEGGLGRGWVGGSVASLHKAGSCRKGD
jgi:hypothetical protein